MLSMQDSDCAVEKLINKFTEKAINGRGYRRGLHIIFFNKNFCYSNIYKYVQKVAQNHHCWSNIRDFISCTGQNTCTKVDIQLAFYAMAFDQCVSVRRYIFLAPE